MEDGELIGQYASKVPMASSFPKQPEERPQIKKKTVQEFLGPFKNTGKAVVAVSTQPTILDLRGFLLRGRFTEMNVKM